LKASVRVVWPVSMPAKEMISLPGLVTFMVFAS
jgi:hypothetical protein